MKRRMLIGLAVLGLAQAAGAHQAMEVAPAAAASQPSHGVPDSAPAPRMQDASAITMGQQVQGQLAQGDEQLGSGEYSDTYRLHVRRGQSVTVRMSSAEVDSYLLVRGPGGLSGDNDDEAAGSLNSRLSFTAPADGEVQIVATSYAPGETGRYALSVEAGGQAVPAGDSRPAPIVQAPAPRMPQQAAPQPLVLGSAHSGTLLPSDRQRTSGKYEDVFTFEGRRGQAIDLRLASDDFDAFLVVSGPDGFSAFNDDEEGARSLNSRLLLALPADGTYRVAVTSFRAGELGTYRLSAATAPAGATPFTQPAARPLAIGGTARGTLSRNDEQLTRGKYVHRYRFTGRRGQRVALELNSSAFDPFLSLIQPDGEQLDNDDSPGPDGRTSLNSRIETVLPEDGQYNVLVTSYREGATGAYELALRPSNGSPRQAQVRGGQRVFAVMVGVSDYGGRTSNLPMTDEDATRLYASLHAAGVLHPSSIVLTNAQATRAAVRDAFRRVAAEAGPDDLFLFFFSGHGDQIRAVRGSNEVDGLTETIELRDGAMTDREMVELFAPLRSRMALLVVDSCFSGGFEEVVNRPNVMGIFSSEEDLTSEVAGRLGAGGYLSHFIRTGLAGDADIDGDRILTAGEIATYLRRQFRTQGEIGASTVDRQQRNYQNLVVRRGGVQVNDVILRLEPQALASAE